MVKREINKIETIMRDLLFERVRTRCFDQAHGAQHNKDLLVLLVDFTLVIDGQHLRLSVYSSFYQERRQGREVIFFDINNPLFLHPFRKNIENTNYPQRATWMNQSL